MADSGKSTLVILTPAFAVHDENWLRPQAGFVRKLNELFPSLHIIIIIFHFPIVPEKRFKWFGNDVVAFNGGRKGGIHTLWRWAQVWRELLRIRKRHSVLGLFSFFCSESAFIGHHFARRHGLRHRIWVMGQDARPDNKQVKRIMPEPDELVTISDFLVREFEKSHGIRPGHTIPIGIDPEHYPAYQPARSIDIIGVGSLSPIKQYDVFIEVVKELTRFMPGIRTAIYGRGTEYSALSRLIEKEHLQHNLHLAGEQKHPDVLHAMQQSKILLHPSSYEGFGMVCTEALYAGAHVVSFCKPMNADIARWHIVSTKEEMVMKCRELLEAGHQDYSGVLPYKLDDTAIEIMKLYDYAPAVEASAG